MANRITLEVTGLREMAIALDRWGEDVEAEARRELEDVVFFTVQDLQRAAPEGQYSAFGDRLGGKLKTSIQGRLDATGVSARIVAKARHAHLVEFGHQGPAPAPPHPWFLPVIIPARRKWYERLKAAIARVRAPGVGDGTAEVVDR